MTAFLYFYYYKRSCLTKLRVSRISIYRCLKRLFDIRTDCIIDASSGTINLFVSFIMGHNRKIHSWPNLRPISMHKLLGMNLQY